MRQDETTQFWGSFPHDDLVVRVAALHTQRRMLQEQLPAEFVNGARAAIAALYLDGDGIEVGAGSRPVLVPDVATVRYGDVRDAADLKVYFGQELAENGFLDATSFAGVADASQDFVISAHVIEHLPDPVGSICQAMRVLKPLGHYLLIVPDKRFTFDVDRPEVTLAHVLADRDDAGAGTIRQAYEEHIRYVHTRTYPPVPEDEIEAEITKAIARKMDIHVHAWTHDGFLAMLTAISAGRFQIRADVTIMNENIFVLQKLPGAIGEGEACANGSARTARSRAAKSSKKAR